MSRLKAALYLASLVAFVACLITLCGCDNRGSSSSPVSEASALPPADVKGRDGIGVAIVVDCSGSMADKVPGGVKEEIARTVVASVVKQCADYSSRNAGRTIEVALYKFDEEQQQLVPFSAPNAFATDKINLLIPNGGTNIGDAILAVKKDLDRTGLSSKHIVVITDGENTGGATPDEVAVAMQKNPQKPSVYMVAFDVNSSVFSGVKQSGWMVYSASDAKELQQTLDQIFGENILLERQ